MLSTKILPDPVLAILKKNPQIYTSLKQSLLLARSFLPKLKHPEIPGRIHPNDFMLKSYSKDGLMRYKTQSQMHFQLIEDNLKDLGKNWADINSFLDMGSGYGRVVRWVNQKLASEQITICDVITEAVRFCQKEFYVNGIVTDADFACNDFAIYDLIFSCSLLTHLSEQRTKKFFQLLNRVTRKDSLIIFSIHGHESLQYSAKINPDFNQAVIEKALAEKGFYYMPYSHYFDKNLGDTFFSLDYLRQALEESCPKIKIVKHIEGPCYGWAHDWVVCQNLG